MTFLYHLAWTLVLLFAIPMGLLVRSERFLGRLALGFPGKRPRPGGIWVHALSVGEVISALPLIQALKRRFPQLAILFTVTTAGGMAVARKQAAGLVDTLIYLPVDAWWCTRRVVRCLCPGLFVLVETDIWPGLLHHLKAQGISSLLVNGRVSPRTFRSYRRARRWACSLFGPFEACLMQSELDRQRLLNIGVPREKTFVAGNLKFDREWPSMGTEERKRWFMALHLDPRDLVWVAGSTHEGEEDILFDVFDRLANAFSNLRLILAPRDPARATELARRCRDKGLNPVLRSRMSRDPSGQVIILDTLGELGRVYGLGDMAFVGGSLTPIGGHNLLEPASFGSPVLFGPHTHNFVEMARALLEAGGGQRIQDREGLFQAMKTLLDHPEDRERMGQRARAYVLQNQGALERVVSHVEQAFAAGAGVSVTDSDAVHKGEKPGLPGTALS